MAEDGPCLIAAAPTLSATKKPAICSARPATYPIPEACQLPLTGKSHTPLAFSDSAQDHAADDTALGTWVTMLTAEPASTKWPRICDSTRVRSRRSMQSNICEPHRALSRTCLRPKKSSSPRAQAKDKV